jgi:Tfp pilus assembly protein PilO
MTHTKASFLHVVWHPAVAASLLALSVVLAVLGLVTVFAWYPARQEGEAADARLATATSELLSLRSKQRLAQSYAIRLPEVELLEGKLRQSKSEPVFVRDIEALAAQSGSKVEQVSSSGEEKAGPVNTALFELILKGRYENLRQFINGLPELNQFVAIERVLIEREGDTVRAFLVMKRRQRAE